MAAKSTSKTDRRADAGQAKSKVPDDSNGKTKSDLPLIVGIGASAGGLDAFKSFFANMPGDTGMAFVLVQHLSPDHKSMLADLLGKVSSMDVIEASDGNAVTPNCVFVIPPDATMTIANGHLTIIRPAPPRDRRRPIDSFFQSLAEDQGERAVAIVLAGTGSDGSLGLASVKEQGGLTLAQAEYDSHALAGMPESAAATGQVDAVLAVEDMPKWLISHQGHLADVAPAKGEDGARTDTASYLATIMDALKRQSGHDFSEYKENTLLRRLQRRMQVLQVDTPAAYIERFRNEPEELDLLFHELLIGVTEFFRDTSAFNALDETVLKELVKGKGAGNEVRVWVPGCATGQEVYSIAILLREAMDNRRLRPKVQIFGTDIDERAIARARSGRFSKPVAGLSPERAERWFIEAGDDYCVAPEIREMCIFSAHSVIKHPPFSRLDLVSCRNLLIYLDAAMQDRVMRTFHYALNSGGRLFLGSSESVTRATRLFDVRDKKHRIFERRDVVAASLPNFSTQSNRRAGADVAVPRGAPTGDGLDSEVRRAMEKHHPPHLVIDRSHQIVRFSGSALAPYLEPSPGAPSFALFDILRKTLRPAARSLLQRSQGSSDTVRLEDVAIRIDGSNRLVTLIADPLAEQGPDAGYVVLAFQDGGPATRKSTPKSGKDSDETAQALQQELRTTRTQLQSTIDELENANEEMKSSNEEFQSVNEEMQSSNEELETAKEEMQSVNEELQTINAELGSKNEQLALLNSDLSNLIESTEIATLFLDDQLRVRRFTRGVSDIFRLRDADIGRPITDIVSLIDYGALKADVRKVLRKLEMVEHEATLDDGKATFTLRIRPYRTVSNVIDGVVLTFVDITARHEANEALGESEGRYRALFDSIDQGFCTLERIESKDGTADFRYLTANPALQTQSGIADVVGSTIKEVLRDEAGEWIDTFERVWRTGEPIRFERGLELQSRILELYAFRIDHGARREVGVIFSDVSDRKLRDEEQELLLREMDHRIKNLFAITGGVVSLSARSAETPAQMAAAIQGRLGALAAAHQLIRPLRIKGERIRTETTLGVLIRAILAPYIDGGTDGGDVVIEGPEIMLGVDAVTSLALVLHELATNAAKYGALSSREGQVGISWTVANGRLELTWRERGGPVINAPPDREGFGSLLARRSINGSLNGTLDHDWEREGLTVRVAAATERLFPKAIE